MVSRRTAGILLVAAAAAHCAAPTLGQLADTPVSPLSSNRGPEVSAGEEIDSRLRDLVREYLNEPQDNDPEAEAATRTDEQDHGASPQRFLPLPLEELGRDFLLEPVVPESSFFSSADIESALDGLIKTIPTDPDTYDYIVVGGGTTGCALADVLSQHGKKVLLLERGMERSLATTPNAMSARGAGIGLADATIAQAVGTVQGVRTFSGALMGGNSSVNLGIVIGETAEYFAEMARQYPGYNINYHKLRHAYEYVAHRVARVMPELPPFGPAFKNALTNSGYRYWGSSERPHPSLFVEMGYQWVGFSLFDANDNLHRNAADALLKPLPNLIVKTRHTVKQVTFINTVHGKTAACVIYHPTTYKDIRPIGDLWSFFPSSAADWAPWVGTFLDPKSVLAAAGVPDPKRKLRRVCLAKPGVGRIILSGGAVHTPLLLYKSGIGPALQLGMIKVPQVLENPAVGSFFSDRVFIAIPGFLKQYADGVSLMNPGGTLRRLQAGEEAGSGPIRRLRLIRNPSITPLQKQGANGPEAKLSTARIMAQSVPDEIATVEEDAEQDVEARFDPPVLLPDFALFPGKLKKISEALQPRVCQFMGVKYFGPNCAGQRINQRNLGCSAVAIEELSGDRTAEGFIFASRYMFPTVFRKDPILDAVTELLLACANYRPPFGIVLLKPLCAVTMPVIKCLRKAVAPFYFTSEPKSRGSIRLKPSGEVVVDPQYLVNDQDLFDAVRGVSVMIEQMNSDVYRGIIQPKGPQSCPVAILNGLLDILLALGSITSPFLTNSKNFPEIQRYLQDLIPADARRKRRLMVVSNEYEIKPAVYEDADGNEYEDYSAFVHHDVDEAVMEKLGIKRRLEEVGFDFEAYRAHLAGTDASANDPSLHLDAVERRLEAAFRDALGHDEVKELEQHAVTLEAGHLRKLAEESPELREAIDTCKKPCTRSSIEQHTCAKTDICCTAFGNAKCIKTGGQPAFASQKNEGLFTAADGARGEDAVKTEEFVMPQLALDAEPSAVHVSKQWAATYPPTLPSTKNPKALAKFALTYMTSIGHVYGGATMGKVVDDKFQVIGVNGLSVADASVLPQLPRLNPVFTLMALGRYAGELMLGV